MSARPPSREQQIRSFLHEHDLQAWIAWRPDELLMLSAYFPFWGASLLIYFADAEPVLFVPQIEPRDHIPAGLRVQEYPWGDLKCSDPYSALIAAIGDELIKANVEGEHVGMNPSASRISLPIQAAEQIPIPEGFARQLSALAVKPNAHHQAAFADLYLRKTSEEIGAIRLANRVANLGLQVFFENLQPGRPRRKLQPQWSPPFIGKLAAMAYFIPGGGPWFNLAPTAPMRGGLIARPDGA